MGPLAMRVAESSVSEPLWSSVRAGAAHKSDPFSADATRYERKEGKRETRFDPPETACSF